MVITPKPGRLGRLRPMLAFSMKPLGSRIAFGGTAGVDSSADRRDSNRHTVHHDENQDNCFTLPSVYSVGEKNTKKQPGE